MLSRLFSLILMLLVTSAWASQPIFTLHGFAGKDGSQPSAPLLLTADNKVFSTTRAGGANGLGAVYRISSAGNFTLLHSFSGIDGSSPNGLVLANDGNYYGTTSAGGNNGNGTVFRVTSAGNLTILYSFSKTTPKPRSVPGVNGTTATITEYVNADGALPQGLTLGADGNLYGTAANGGTNGNGVVFRIATNGAFATIYNFTELAYGQPVPTEQQIDLTNADGASPNSSLVLGADGAFYGVAAFGGPNGQGVIFRITTGGVLTRLTSYGGTYEVLVHQPGPPPTATIAETETITLTAAADGSFYGTTEGKATQTGLGAIPQTDFGSIFHLTQSGTLTTLHSFTVPDVNHRNADGASPIGALLIGPNGHLYGTGSAGGESGAGAIFELAPDGSSFNTLYSFNVGDGMQPEGSMTLGSNGNLYGTAINGGPNSSSNGGGVVFEVATTPLSFVLHEFNGNDGFSPISLLQGKDGDFYGVNYSSTTNGIGEGTVFRAHLANADANIANVTTLHSFGYVRPGLGLIQGKDGALYGSTSQATFGDFIYRITTAGAFNSIYSFVNTHATDGGNPMAGVVQATNGDFYGVNYADGSLGGGTLFHLKPTGSLNVAHAFSGNGFEGYAPTTPLMQASDGKLYGMTNRGGVAPNSADGAIFSMTLSGTFTNLHAFGSRVGESVNPFGALIEGQDGFLYGTTLGIFEPSTIFKIPKTADASRPNDLVTVHTFTNAEGGHSSGLVQTKDGNFYGLLGTGGSTITGGVGIVYRLTPSGNLSVIHQFYGPDGSQDSAGRFYAPLVQGNDGNLYGVTPAGGTTSGNPLCYSNYTNGTGCGTFFRLAIGRPGGAVDVTNQIVSTFKGSSNLPGGIYKYTFTFTNNGEDLPGPVYMVLDNLPLGSTVINADGVTQQTSPTNIPFITIAKGNFAKGATTSPVSLVINHRLTNPFTHRYLSGPGHP